MSRSTESEEKLERLVGEVLRDQPPLVAPATLESRVLAALKRRAALPWWRMEFGRWPMPVRLLFLLASAGLVRLTLLLSEWVATDGSRQVSGSLAPELGALRSTAEEFGTLREVVTLVAGSIPPSLVYGGLVVVLALYCALFGIGTAAYRTLYGTR